VDGAGRSDGVGPGERGAGGEGPSRAPDPGGPPAAGGTDLGGPPATGGTDLGGPPAAGGTAAGGTAAAWRSHLTAARPVAAWALVAPLAVWLALRVSGVGAGTWIETLVVFTPYVALASVVGLVVVALLRVRAALVATGACCLGYALVMAPLFAPGPRPSPAPTGPELRVMTVNVLYGWADPDQVVELVDDQDVDVLGVQELTPEFHEALLDAGLDDRLPHRVVDARPGPSGTGLYSRHPVARTDHDVAGRHENPTASVSVPGARPVEVTVVHPVPPVGADGRADWRATFRTLPRPDGRTVRLLLGDFNATLDQPTMRDLVGDGYVDAADAEGRAWVATWRSRFPLALAIDHVLVDRDVAVERVAVRDVDGSDHRALVAALRLPAAGPED
jgi:endonuclease/exonuclease/phosphatase (EEP) superfamily protein YafD